MHKTRQTLKLRNKYKEIVSHTILNFYNVFCCCCCRNFIIHFVLSYTKVISTVDKFGQQSEDLRCFRFQLLLKIWGVRSMRDWGNNTRFVFKTAYFPQLQIFSIQTRVCIQMLTFKFGMVVLNDNCHGCRQKVAY